MQGLPIRLAVVIGAAELVLASDVVDELCDIDDSDGGLIPDGFGIERTPILLPGAGIPLVGFTTGG